MYLQHPACDITNACHASNFWQEPQIDKSKVFELTHSFSLCLSVCVSCSFFCAFLRFSSTGIIQCSPNHVQNLPIKITQELHIICFPNLNKALRKSAFIVPNFIYPKGTFIWSPTNNNVCTLILMKTKLLSHSITLQIQGYKIHTLWAKISWDYQLHGNKDDLSYYYACDCFETEDWHINMWVTRQCARLTGHYVRLYLCHEYL